MKSLPISDLNLIFSEVSLPSSVSGTPLRRIAEPSDYYNGVDCVKRCISRRVLLFERRTRAALQQKHLANRMHHRHVLIFAEETGGLVSVDGRPLRLEAGAALLVCPFQFHFYLDTDADELRWIFLTFELAEGSSLLEPLRHRILRPGASVRRLLEEIVDAWASVTEEDRSVILPLTDQFLMRLCRETSSHELGAKRDGGDLSWIAEVESLVIRSVHQGQSIHTIGTRMGLSARHLRSRFERHTGISLRDYRNNYQLHRAIALMRDTALSLGDVAELSGFQSQPVFNRFIRRRTGQTPGGLRKMVVDGALSPRLLEGEHD